MLERFLIVAGFVGWMSEVHSRGDAYSETRDHRFRQFVSSFSIAHFTSFLFISYFGQLSTMC
jgi:hypothetical protein